LFAASGNQYSGMGQPGVPVGLIMACFSVNAFASANEQKGYPKVPGSNELFFQKEKLKQKKRYCFLQMKVQVPLPTLSIVRMLILLVPFHIIRL